MTSTQKRTLGALGILTILTAAVFAQTANFQFINFDVSEYITKNRMVLKGLTWQGFIWAWTTTRTCDWQPLTWLSWMLDMHIFGLNARAFHLMNVFLHWLNVLLVFEVLRRYSRHFWAAAITAAFFAIHPLRAESVVWVAERKDVLSTLFLLIALLFYADFVESGRRLAAYIKMSLVFVLGLLAKPMLVTLPFMMLLLDYWPFKRWGKEPARRLVAEKIPLMIFSAFSSAMTIHAVCHGGCVQPTGIAFLARLSNAIVAPLRYLEKTFWPSDLTFYYLFEAIPFFSFKVLASAIFLTALTALLFLKRKKYPYALIGWLWFMGTLFPVIGLIQIGGHSIANRYMYVPHIFFLFAVTMLVLAAFRKFKVPNTAAGGLIAGVLIMTSIISWREVNYWETPTRLNHRALEINPLNPVPYLNLSYIYMTEGDHKNGLFYAKKAEAISPGDSSVSNHLAFYLVKEGREEALEFLRGAIKLTPNRRGLQFNYALLHMQMGRLEEALELFKKIVDKWPYYETARRCKLDILLKLSRFEEAKADAKRLIELNLKNDSFYYILAGIHSELKEFSEAIGMYSYALKLNPKNVPALNDIGILYYNDGNYPLALSYFERAAALEPHNAGILRNLGRTLGKTKQFKKAEAALKESLRLQPDFAAYLSLGIIMEDQGKWKEAIKFYSKALQLNPDMPFAHKRLADALVAIGEKEKAIAHYKTALQINPGFTDAAESLRQVEMPVPSFNLRVSSSNAP